MKKIKLIVLFILLSFILTGCFEKKEVEDLAYVIAIGVDKGTENKYSITFQLAVPIKIAGEGSDGSGKESTSLITLETNTISNSISRADAMISKEITLSHNKIIVLSENVAKEGITDLLAEFITNPEIRPKTSLLVHTSSAKDFLSNLEPILEKNPARYYDLLLASNEYTGYTIDNDIFHFYLATKDDFSTPYALLTESIKDENSKTSSNSLIKSKSSNNEKTKGANEENEEDGQSSGDTNQKDNQSSSDTNQKNSQSSGNTNQKNSQSSGDTNQKDSQSSGDTNQKDNQSSGDTNEKSNQNSSDSNEKDSQSSGDTNEEDSAPQTANVLGIALFKEDKMIGELKDEDIVSHVILQGNLKKVNIDVEDIKDKNKSTVVKLFQTSKPKIKVKVENNIPEIDITVKINAELVSSGSPIDYSDGDNKDKLAKNIRKKITEDLNSYINKISKEYKVDPIGFGKYYKITILTLDELEKVNWKELYPNSNFKLNLELHLDVTQMVSSETP